MRNKVNLNQLFLFGFLQTAQGLQPFIGKVVNTEDDQSVLSKDERKELKKLKAIVRDTADAFKKLGTALLELKNNKLYRECHGSVEKFCQQEFGYEVLDLQKLIGQPENSTQVATPSLEEGTIQTQEGK